MDVSINLVRPPPAFHAIGLSNHCLRGMAACAAANSQSWFSVRKKRRMSKTQTAGPSAIPMESVPDVSFIDDLKRTSPPPFEKLKIDALGWQRMARPRALTQRG